MAGSRIAGDRVPNVIGMVRSRLRRSRTERSTPDRAGALVQQGAPMRIVDLRRPGARFVSPSTAAAARRTSKAQTPQDTARSRAPATGLRCAVAFRHRFERRRRGESLERRGWRGSQTPAPDRQRGRRGGALTRTRDVPRRHHGGTAAAAPAARRPRASSPDAARRRTSGRVRRARIAAAASSSEALTAIEIASGKAVSFRRRSSFVSIVAHPLQERGQPAVLGVA